MFSDGFPLVLFLFLKLSINILDKIDLKAAFDSNFSTRWPLVRNRLSRLTFMLSYDLKLSCVI